MKLMLAKPYAGQNPVGWMMSEKLDGVRAVWDGAAFKSRSGNTLQVPAWFSAGLPPDVVLDGELWEGRGQFQQSVGKVRSGKGEWSGMRFMIFDTVSDQPFTARLHALQALDLPAHCAIVEHVRCESEAHLEEYERTVLAQGGEGVMLRRADSPYQHKRSADLLKLKRFQTDEAVIVGYKDGLGRNAGLVGAFVCEWMGKTFQLGAGLSDHERGNPPALGSRVTFSFFDTTDGCLPRHPSFVGVRDYE